MKLLKKSDNNSSREIEKIDQNLRKSFKAVKEELDEHLMSINENTNEIQNSYEHIAETDERIEKLNERLDTLQLMMQNIVHNNLLSGAKVSLSLDEQKVFLVLYAFSEKNSLSIQDIARRANIDELSVKDLLKNILAKGVVLMEETIEGNTYLKLDPEFKELQAKNQVVEIDQLVVNQVFNKKIMV